LDCPIYPNSILLDNIVLCKSWQPPLKNACSTTTTQIKRARVQKLGVAGENKWGVRRNHPNHFGHNYI